MKYAIKTDEARVKHEPGDLVRTTVEDTLNAMLDAETDQTLMRQDMRGAKLVKIPELDFTTVSCIPKPVRSI